MQLLESSDASSVWRLRLSSLSGRFGLALDSQDRGPDGNSVLTRRSKVFSLWLLPPGMAARLLHAGRRISPMQSGSDSITSSTPMRTSP